MLKTTKADHNILHVPAAVIKGKEKTRNARLDQPDYPNQASPLPILSPILTQSITVAKRCPGQKISSQSVTSGEQLFSWFSQFPDLSPSTKSSKHDVAVTKCLAKS